MLIFKYNKLGSAAFIPHTDTLRAIIRTIRRAGIPVKYSSGYNPHMNLYMSPPLPLGTESISEYCAADTDIPAEEFSELYNKSCVKGMECTKVFTAVKNPNMAANIAAAEYVIESGFLSENFDSLDFKHGFAVTSEREGVITVKESGADILKTVKTAGGIDVILKFGNCGNLRIDRFIETLRQKTKYFECAVLKTESYCTSEGKLITADEFIKGKS